MQSIEHQGDLKAGNEVMNTETEMISPQSTEYSRRSSPDGYC